MTRAILCALGLAACGGGPAVHEPEIAPMAPAAEVCPTEPIAAERAPDVSAELERAEPWIEALGAERADRVLVAPAQIAALQARLDAASGGWRDPLSREFSAETVRADTAERLASMRAELSVGRLVEAHPGALAEAAERTDAASAIDQTRLVAAQAQLHCVPTEHAVFKHPIDDAFDRNLCTTLHPGEIVRVLARAGEGRWLAVHAGHTLGWLHDATLSPKLAPAEVDAWRAGPHVLALADDVRTKGGVPLRLGVAIPGRRDEGGAWAVRVPTVGGIVDDAIVADAPVGAPPVLTLRTLFTIALGDVGSPYGWGGRGGARDCSQWLRDVLATFGLQLGRHSSTQAEQGTEVSVVDRWPVEDKLAEIERLADKGAVILYMPGHIMLYLGRRGEDHYAVSSIAEFLVPRGDGCDVVHRLDRVAVTTLELGRGSARTSFIERITRIAVIGGA